MIDSQLINRQDSDSEDNLAERLRKLLGEKNKKTEAWQIETGKLVALSSIKFQSDVSNDKAFELLALISLAKKFNVKEAKKRTINLSRWLTISPPSTKNLSVPSEKLAVVDGLRAVKFPWVIDYITNEFNNELADHELQTKLLEWGNASCQNLPQFIAAVYAPSLNSIADVKTMLKFLKLSEKLFGPYLNASPHELAIALKQFSTVIVGSIYKCGKNKKQEGALLQAALGVLVKSSHQIPTLLIQPNFISAYDELIAELQKVKKISAAFFTEISTAALDLIFDRVLRSDNSTQSSLYAIQVAWGKVIPNFNNFIKTACGQNPALKSFFRLSSISIDKPIIDDKDNSESAFAALLPAWLSYVAELADKDSVESLTHLICSAAKSANIEYFGEPETITPYNPLQHSLSHGKNGPPQEVQILRPGVLIRRKDNSTRVLVTAFVSPV